jgi:hypothetical protein
MRKFTIGILLTVVLLTAGFAGLLSGPGGAELQTAFEHDRILSLDTNGMNQSDPDIAMQGDTLFVVWSDDRNGTWDIISRTSKDAGATWGPEVMVDDTLRNKVGYDDRSDQTGPRAAIDSDGTIYVAWVDDRDGRDMVYMGASSDGGTNFSTSHLVSDTSGGHQGAPDIIGNGEEVYLVWEDTKGGKEGIYWTRTSDGVNFDSAVPVSDAPSSVMCLDPAIACTQNAIHVAWSDDRAFDLDIYLSSSYDGGATWSASALVSRDPSSSDQFEPEIVANSTTLFCLFVDTRYSSADVFMAVSRDAGLTFEKEYLLNSENSKGAQTGIRADINPQGNMSVVWTSSPGFFDSKADIQTLVVMPNGSIGAIATVNDPVVMVSQGEPSCAMSGSNMIHCVWADYRRPDSPGSSSTQKDVYYTRSTDSGEEGKAPVIDSVKVSPEVGKAGDPFTFLARYSDVEGDAPVGGAPLLHVYFMSNGRLFYYQGAPFTMNKKLIPPQDQDYRNGEEYIYTVTIEKGLDIYFQIGATAESGNQTEVRTPLQHLPMIDINAPTFTKLSPMDGAWSNSNIVELVVKVTDLQSGVDPTTISFRRYLPNQAGWEERWQSRGTYTSDGNGSIIFRGNMTFDDSDGNLVRFRARDMAGNPTVGYPYAISPDYPIWVDTKGPVVTMDSPRTGSIISSPTVDIEARVIDEGCGVDPDSVEVSYKLDGSSVYSMWANLSEYQDVEVLELMDGYFVSFDVPLAYGTFNFVRIRSKDLLGNQGSSGEVQLIIKKETPVVVDRPPGPVTSIQPKVTGSLMPHITWAQAVDPEGDSVSYKFRILQSGMSEPFLDWVELSSGTTYWDPPETMEFTSGAQYTIEIIPVANKLEGPLARSTLAISTDANSPPGKVEDMSPKATGESRPVLRWTPSLDPEGSHVYYFIRIWREATGAVLVPWTTVANGTAFRVPVELMMGVYTVNILSSDGTDFSPMSTFLLSLGVFSPKVNPERSLIVIYQDTSVSINVTVENEGYLFDTIGIVLTGAALQDQTLEIILSKGSVDLVAGGAVNVTLSISAADFAAVGFRSMNITVRSGDGVTTYSRPISIRVVDPDDPYGGEVVPGPQPGSEDDSTTIVYIMVIVMFLLIAGMVIAFIMVDRRQREERVEIVRDQLPVQKREGLKGEGSPKREKLRGREGKKRLPPKP